MLVKTLSIRCRQTDDKVFQLSISCDSLSTDVVGHFVEAHRLPPLVVYSRETWRLIAGSHVTDHVLMFINSVSMGDLSHEMMSEFRRTAELYRDQVGDNSHSMQII
jgi:hypothetical protein